MYLLSRKSKNGLDETAILSKVCGRSSCHRSSIVRRQDDYTIMESCILVMMCEAGV